MPLNRLTFFFEQGENGWSEAIHTTSTSIPGLVAAATAYRNVRMPLLNAYATLVHVRISDDMVFRDVLFDPFRLPQSGLFGKSFPAEAPWTAIDVRLGASPTVQRSLFLRGLPAGMISDTTIAGTPSFNASLAAYATRLLNAEFAIKNKDRGQFKQPITSIDAAGNVVMGIPLTGVNQQSVIQVLGIPRSVIPIRFFKVNTVTDQSHFQLRGWAGQTVGARGFLRPDVQVLSTITGFQTTVATERRVGRPFGQQRGRRAVIR
jgi:hypothetical protein